MMVPTRIPGTGLTIGVPGDWRTETDPQTGILSVEDDYGRFVASVSVMLDGSRSEPLPDPSAAATAMLLAPVVIDVGPVGDTVDIVICHLAGNVSATACQRQILIPEGLLVVTFTAATSRWGELCDLAADVLDSIGAAA